jgi:hypothetical protein
MRSIRIVLLGVAANAAGCGGASPETGITAYLRASNAQFVPGAMPPPKDNSGPAVRNVNLVNTTVYPGLVSFPLSGTVEQGVSVLVGLVGDSGYWIVPSPLPDPQVPTDFGFSTQLAFSPLLPHGKQTLAVEGIDAAGKIGSPSTLPLTVNAPTEAGDLVFTLTWDTQADLDLHVVIPNSADPTKPIEIWSRAPVGLTPPGPADPPPDQATIDAAPHLDFDSNAACVIDGRRKEKVIITGTPPSGEYIARVDAFSMCGQAAAQWLLEVTTPAYPVVNPATWQATDADTRGAHGVGAGRLAVKFPL